MNYIFELEGRLTDACVLDDEKWIKQILDTTLVSVNLKASNGDSLLHIACVHNSIEAVKELLKHSPDLEILNKSHHTPLLMMATHNNITIVKLLIEAGANVNAVYRGESVLYHLINSNLKNNYDTIMLLLDRDDILVNTQSTCYGQSTPLHNAVLMRRTEIIKKLLKRGASIDVRDYLGSSALLYASYNGHTEIVDILLKHGSDINLQNGHGDTALLKASFHGHTDIVDILLKHGSDINLQNVVGDTALLVASRHGYTDIVDILLKHGSDINLQNVVGDIALHKTISMMYFTTAKRLLDDPRIIIDKENSFNLKALDVSSGYSLKMNQNIIDLMAHYKKLVADEISKSGVVIPDLAKIIADYMH